MAEALSPFLESRSMPSLIAPYTLLSENTTEAQLSKNFSQMYILMGKALYSRNECCNNQLKTIFSQTIHFSGIFNKIIKFWHFSRTGKTVVIFPGAVGTLCVTRMNIQLFLNYHEYNQEFHCIISSFC